MPILVLPKMFRILSSSYFLLAVCALCTECYGLPTENVRAQLSRIWQEEFVSPEDSSPAASLASNSIYPADAQRGSQQPHPAVVRVIVPEQGATSYGSGTLVDIRENFGLVITNWHVVRDAQGPVEVMFPGGFTSQARALKVDADWDLAALVVWRPPVQPVKIAALAPKPGDQLTICGYGQGMYRSATGRCTDYYAPRPDFPRQMVELDVQARQGDSGGPIFNSQGELAGVLFGAGQGTTLGSFGGRVDSFLATLAPDIGQTADGAPRLAGGIPTNPFGPIDPPLESGAACPQVDGEPKQVAIKAHSPQSAPAHELANADRPDFETAPSSTWPVAPESAPGATPGATPGTEQVARSESVSWQPVVRNSLFEQMKTVLAAVGLLAIAVQVLRAAR